MKNIPIPKLITFDWDETLADTRSCVVHSMEIVLSTYGKEKWDVVKKKYRDKNKSLKENFPNFFGEDADVAYKLYLETYVKNIKEKVSPLAGSRELLSKLNELKIPCSVISNKETSILKTEISMLFPNISFNCILGNGDANRNKPDAAPIIKACELANVATDKDTVWHVGDSKQDTDCARNANVTAVLVGEGKFFDDELEDEIYQISDLSFLDRYIGNG